MTPHSAFRQRPRELVHLLGDWKGDIPDCGAMVEQKLDGVRAYWLGGKIRTREGVEIHGVGHIAWRISAIERVHGRPIFLDGEFIAPGGYRDTLGHIGSGPRAPEQGTLHVFDCLHADEWQANDCDRPLYARKAMLADLVALGGDSANEWEWRPGTYGKEPDSPALTVIPDVWCDTAADVEKMACQIWDKGGEGVVIKDAESIYRRERSNRWQKYKRNGWSTRKVA